MNKKIVINDVFEEIDQHLIEQNVPIKLRCLKAVEHVSKYFDNVPIPLSKNSPLPNNSLGNQLGEWLLTWYEEKYGTLQSYNSDLGFFYQRIRGDLWFYRVPNFIGHCSFFIDKDLTNKGAQNETNIMRMSAKMTQAYVNSLTEEELNSLGQSFCLALEAFQILNTWKLKKIPFFPAIEADFQTISVQLQSNSMNYGQARWAYSQCAEKILKAWLLNAGINKEELQKKYGHNIHKLVNAFNKHYAKSISTNGLNSIICSAGVRYDEGEFSSKDIIKAQTWLFKTIITIGTDPKLEGS
ncbi:hypothetical protein [Pseudoalteromonas phenolica]|uniref:hypothetical protein n=1 Tax=Pseudoalteromonas phenolica TaxID=161398 RepID=UPI00384A8AF7